MLTEIQSILQNLLGPKYRWFQHSAKSSDVLILLVEYKSVGFVIRQWDKNGNLICDGSSNSCKAMRGDAAIGARAIAISQAASSGLHENYQAAQDDQW